jgi:hypothetical protein
MRQQITKISENFNINLFTGLGSRSDKVHGVSEYIQVEFDDTIKLEYIISYEV